MKPLCPNESPSNSVPLRDHIFSSGPWQEESYRSMKAHVSMSCLHGPVQEPSANVPIPYIDNIPHPTYLQQ